MVNRVCVLFGVGALMPWGRMDDKFHRNPKVRALRRLKGPGREALGCWVFWWSWCLDDAELTGFVPSDELPPSDLRSAQRLVEAGLWDAVDGGYQFHDFGTYNPTSAQVAAKREADRERIASKRAASREDVASDSDATFARVASTRVPSHPIPTSPIPSQPAPDQIQTGAPPQTATAPAALVPVVRQRRAPQTDTELPSFAAWTAYTTAYQRRYGVAPVRNAKVNSQIRDFCSRIPAEDAVATIDHYVRSQNARYVASGHSVGAMLADAEKLRTEAVTGRQSTAFAARDADKRAGRGEQYAELLAKFEAEDAEESRGKN